MNPRGLLQKKKESTGVATDFDDTLPFDPSPVASVLKKQLSEIEAVDSQSPSPKTSQVCRSLAHEFSGMDAKSGMVWPKIDQEIPLISDKILVVAREFD